MDPSRAYSGVILKIIVREVTKNIRDYGHVAVYRVRFHAKISREFCRKRARAHPCAIAIERTGRENPFAFSQNASSGQHSDVPAGGRGGADVSDDGLIEMLNGSIHMQMFCGVLIDPAKPIKNGKIVSAIRQRIAGALDIKELQKLLYDKWGGLLKDKNLCLTDATCYESHLRFPTDVKLLWECCEWIQSLIKKTCKALKERLPRNKYRDIDRDRLTYAKHRKHTRAATAKLRRRLLGLLSKQIGQWNRICKIHTVDITLTAEQSKRLSALKEVYRQQSALAQKKEVKHRIVSIDRPYIRPIVRGKENKRVEF